MQEADILREDVRVELDEIDESRQSLLFWYPSVVGVPGEYVRSAVKIESGAKSALDPHQSVSVVPYIAADFPNFDLRVEHVTAVNPERTFWDKIVILHGQRRWFERRGQLRHGDQRVSRHYYDIFKLIESPVGQRAIENTELGVDCTRLFSLAQLSILNMQCQGHWRLPPPWKWSPPSSGIIRQWLA